MLATFVLAPYARAAAPLKCPPPTAEINIVNGIYSSQPGVVFQLRGFVGHVVPRGKHPPLCYVKFTQLERGEIFVSSESLSNIFTQKLEDASSKLKNVKIETGDKTVRITGKFKKVVPVSFEIDGPVSTDGTGITIEALKIKAEGIPVKGLLELLGKHLNSLMGGENFNGVSVQGNSLTFQPAQLAQLRGHIESAIASPAGLTLRYGSARAAKAREGQPHSPSVRGPG
jgi:hypothetical protein